MTTEAAQQAIRAGRKAQRWLDRNPEAPFDMMVSPDLYNEARRTIEKLLAHVEAQAQPPQPQDWDVCASCGHYASAHGKTCDGWMPAGAGHNLTECPCAGFVHPPAVQGSAQAPHPPEPENKR